MSESSLLDRPTAGLSATYLARVVSVDDPEHLGRVQVRMIAYDGPNLQDAPVWARVAVPVAGNQYGAFLLPDVNDEVLITFINGDTRMPMVIGSLWNGAATPPEQLGGSGQTVDRWTLVGKAGTRIAIVEEQAGNAVISLSTPGNVSATLRQGSGGSVELTTPSTSVKLDSSGVTVRTQGAVQVQASSVTVNAPRLTVTADSSTFTGDITCRTLNAVTVVGGNYSPGVGQIW